MIVVDASSVLEVLLRTPAAAAVERRLFAPGETVHARHVIDLEAALVLRRFATRGEIDAAFGRSALADLAGFPPQRYPHDILRQRIWQPRDNLTACDAAYAALAEALDAPLLTRDPGLAAAPGHQSRIELL